MKKIGEKWDFPDHSGKGGTTTTGNTARRLFLNEEMRNFVVAGDGICETHKCQLKKYGQRLAVTLLRLMSRKKILTFKLLNDFV